MTNTEELLAQGQSPFAGQGGEARVWQEASDVLAGERSRDLVAAIDTSFPELQERATAVTVLLAALGSLDTLTALGAGTALVRHQHVIQEGARAQLADGLAAHARDWTDAYRASQALFLLVLLARVDARFIHLAADSALRAPTEIAANAVAERVVSAIALLDAGGADDQLLARLRAYGGATDELVQAESQLQMGRALMRRALRRDGTADPQFIEARAAFARAAAINERTDAQLWHETTELLSVFSEGVPARAQIDGAITRVRTLAFERLHDELGAAPLWTLTEGRLLLRAAEQMAFAAETLTGVADEPSLGEPLASLARAAALTTPLEWSPDMVDVGDALGTALTHSVALSLDAEVAQARAKVQRLIDRTEPDASERAFLMRLRADLEAIAARPKATGAAAETASPARSAEATAFLQTQRTALATQTGSPLGDEVLASLWSKLRPLVAGGDTGQIELIVAALEVVVGFVHDRTADPTSLRTQRRPYLIATAPGLGQTALEEDLRRDLLDYIQAGPYSYLLAKERGHMDGRTDLQFVRPPSPPLTFETKRELTDASRSNIKAAHVLQAQTYVAVGPRVGFLLVLDLTTKAASPEPDIRDRVWIERVDPKAGAGEHPDYVVVAMLSGNRVPPHERKFGNAEQKPARRSRGAGRDARQPRG